MYPRSGSSVVACLHSYSVGRGSVVVLLIWSLCIITVDVSILSFRCCVSIFPWCIYTGITSTFISASFSASMRDDMSCFPGTTLACLIATSFRRPDICSTLIRLNPKALHIFCILIGLHHPSEKYFPPIHKAKELLKNSSCGPETAIGGHVPSSD